MIKTKKRIAAITEGLPPAYCLLWRGTLINRLGGFVIPFLELAFEPDLFVGRFNVTAPANANIAPPGFYMFFVVRDPSESTSGTSKIPSNAVFVKLSLS